LSEYLLSADVGIEPKQSSSGEGSGKLLHYMAAGLAIAAFPTKHNQELAGNDAFAKEHSATALAQHIAQLADNPARCHELGKQNREKVEPFSLESGGHIIARVYRDLNLPCSSELPG
jgi:glycosyltransferase involved in cell wall biosynthesis